MTVVQCELSDPCNPSRQLEQKRARVRVVTSREAGVRAKQQLQYPGGGIVLWSRIKNSEALPSAVQPPPLAHTVTASVCACRCLRISDECDLVVCITPANGSHDRRWKRRHWHQAASLGEGLRAMGSQCRIVARLHLGATWRSTGHRSTGRIWALGAEANRFLDHQLIWTGLARARSGFGCTRAEDESGGAGHRCRKASGFRH